MGTHSDSLEAILMCTHNICLLAELTKIILQLSIPSLSVLLQRIVKSVWKTNLEKLNTTQLSKTEVSMIKSVIHEPEHEKSY